MSRPIKKLTIRGFKSIRNLHEFELRDLNILIGANGSGKSNFVSYFRMLNELVERPLFITFHRFPYPRVSLSNPFYCFAIFPRD